MVQASGSFDIPHKGEANQLGWRRVWTTTDDSDQKVTQGMDLLARIVTLRLIDELREKLGATYGGGASSSMSNLYPGRGTFSISTSGDPKDLAAIEATVDGIIAELTAAPAEADLFERARKPVLESYADWRKRNETWIGVVAEAQTNPARLDRFRRSEELFKTITPDDLFGNWRKNGFRETCAIHVPRSASGHNRGKCGTPWRSTIISPWFCIRKQCQG